jgi:rhodanese-related sulfurtransferase
MLKKSLIMVLTSVFILGLSNLVIAAKVPAPQEGGQGFKAVSLDEAKKLHENGAIIIACHSHTTDYMKGHPTGTIHITCLVPKDHKRTDLPLNKINFDVAQLPADKTTPIVTYCASNT